MDKHLTRLSKCATCLTDLPARSHYLTLLITLAPLVLSIALLAYSETQRSFFPLTQTQWRSGLAGASLLLCVLAPAAIHYRAVGSLTALGWVFSVLGHYFFVLATVDAQFARDVCQPVGWREAFCATTSAGALKSLATAAGLDSACLITWLFYGGVLHQRAVRLAHLAEVEERAAALAAEAGGAAGAGKRTITVTVG